MRIMRSALTGLEIGIRLVIGTRSVSFEVALFVLLARKLVLHEKRTLPMTGSLDSHQSPRSARNDYGHGFGQETQGVLIVVAIE
jgi:hypothetical protein